jgi:hypothetical protein
MNSTQYAKYEVDSGRFRLGIGQVVAPETVIGLHHETGRPVKAELHGRVATVYYNPMHNSLMILAVSNSAN